MNQEPERTDPHVPYFFLSYAHTPRRATDGPDPDMWVHRLYQDLCEHILMLTDLPEGESAGFMDRAMRIGEDWSSRLSAALATCRVFVPLYSPRYFASDHCGREWRAFALRQARGRTSQATALPAIVPALWTPVQAERLPSTAKSLHHDHERFGPHYASEGLYSLMKLRRYRTDYEHAVLLLARAIVTTAHENPVPRGEPQKLADLPNAFGSPPVLRRLRIVVAAPSSRELPPGRSERCYGPSPVDWNPYRESDGDTARPLADFAAEQVRGLDYLTTVEPLDEAVGSLLAEARPSAPTVMLLDRWAVADPEQRELLTRVDAAAQPWVVVIVPWDLSDPDNESSGTELQLALEKTLPRTLQRGRSVSRAATGGVPSLAAFADILPTVIQWAAAQFLRYVSPVYPPAGPPVPRPRLLGPVPEPGVAQETRDDPEL
ncbi:TIR domain-containing protein [Streptomyces sp. D2-8]|uniref:TIR-like protein FxsC n=1 Tax=Streptomyces sp. D2-8 TaxID=2707767 RepID=UPI0020C010AD|nr:TIR-like protein FxsC [Streptomyces sp. D2-8]MCK8435104.1 TIR domain-containing protein [Streptomyces sp. D2-8]